MKCFYLAGLYLLASLVCAFAQDPKNSDQDSPGPAIVGQVVPLEYGPIDNRFGTNVESEAGVKRWVQTITVPGAYFVKVYFEDFRLRKGDRLEILDAYGNIKQTIFETGPGGKSDFWSLSVPGDTLWLEIYSETDYTKHYAFQISKTFEGTANLFGVEQIAGFTKGHNHLGHKRSECSDPQALDYRAVKCYDESGQFEDSAIWNNAQATVGVLTIGDYGNGTWCSGSLVSSQDYVMTNQHCIEDLSGCGTSEFVFNYFDATCSTGLSSPGSITTQGYYCDDTDPENFFLSPIGGCTPEGLDVLDFTFAKVLLNGPDLSPSSQYPVVEMELNHEVIQNTNDLYIIGHPEGSPKVVSEGVMGFTSEFGLHYIAQTLGGSSGSPVFSRDTHRMIGLHHCGGCNTPGELNRGMFISQIRGVLDGLGDFFEPIPNLSFENLVFSDADGDDDGAFDFGEIITVTGTLVNRGTLVSAAGTLTLSGVEGVNFLGDTSLQIDSLNPDQGTDGFEFAFILASESFGCPDSFSVGLQATYGERSSTSTSRFSIGKPGDSTGTVDASMTGDPIAIPDNAPGISSTITVTETGNILSPIEVSVDITHSYIGDLRVVVVSPEGTSVTLHGRSGGSAANLLLTYGDGSNGTVLPADGDMNALFGLEANGDWRLEVTDSAHNDIGLLNDWSLNLGLGAFDCGSVPAMMIGSVAGSWGESVSVPVSYESAVDGYGFRVHFNPYMLNLTGVSNHQVGACAPAMQLVSPGVYDISGNCNSPASGGALLDLEFEALAISGYAEVSASQMSGGLSGVTSLAGGVDLTSGLNTNPCMLPSLQFESRWLADVWYDLVVDENEDGVVNIRDLVSRVNCPETLKFTVR